MRQDLLTTISNEKNVNNIIVLTHNIDFIFIQTVLLRYLTKMGNPSLTIFADAQCVQDSYQDQKLIIIGLGKRYRVVPVNLSGTHYRFHPKAVLLSGEDKASLFIGSGNLTFGGWRQNAEIWHSYSTENGTAVFNAFKDYLNGILDRLPSTHNINKSVTNAYNKKTASWSDNMDTPSGLIGRINSNIALIKQMQNYLSDGCQKIIIQSPYFDLLGKTIKQINDIFQPEKIEILAQNKHSDLTHEIINTFSENTSVTPTGFHHKNGKSAFIHAKFYAFIYSKKVIVFSGSANCSQAALAINKPLEGNAELMNVLEMSLEEFDENFYKEIEKVELFEPKKQTDVEDSYSKEEVFKAIRINYAQLEYKQLRISIQIQPSYKVVGCIISNIHYPVNIIDSTLVFVDGCDEESTKIVLIIENKETSEKFYSDEVWIDHENDLSKSSKTRLLNDFIHNNSNQSWNHDVFADLLKIFYQHLAHTPINTNAKSLGSTNKTTKKPIMFNPKDIYVDNYDFISIPAVFSTKATSSFFSILQQYLGIYSLHNKENDELELTQEELEDQLEKGTIKINSKDDKKQNNETPPIDEKNQKKIRKLVDTLVAELTSEENITHRPLTVLLDDLKIASIILRLGLNKAWISHEEYFDTTYKLWTEFFFSANLENNADHLGYIELKLNQEDINPKELQSTELNAAMLTWLCAIEPSNDLRYIRLLMSAILVQAKFEWIFGSEYKSIGYEIHKVLTPFEIDNMSNALENHLALWKLIVEIGNAFSEFLQNLQDKSVKHYKDLIPIREVTKGELLWQGNENFYITQFTFRRETGKNTTVVPLNNKKTTTSFKTDSTIPIRYLLELDEFSHLKYKHIILNFIDSFLINKPINTL